MEAYRHMGGIQMYGGIQTCGCVWTWECRDTGVYGHMGAYGCTCLPTASQGICKKFSFPFIMSHVHHLSTKLEGKKPTKMP